MIRQCRVLVVDDDKNILSAFEDFFKKEHCSMIAASSAEEAVAIVKHEHPNLVITDVKMKWQSGVTLLLKIKEIHPDVPVIVITGYPNLVPEEDVRHYGAAYYFVKPLELEQLRSAVRRCLDQPSAFRDRQ